MLGDEEVKKIGLVIPTYNAGQEFDEVLNLINNQDEVLYRKLIIDSESKDFTLTVAIDKGFEVKRIKSSEFGHGKTRTLAAETLNDCYYIIFMTQDVFLQKDALRNLIKFIESNSNLGVVYGRQEVDMNKSNIFEKKAREFNYPKKSLIKTYKDKEQLGIKTVFSSNAFSIYNSLKLEEIGSFPNDLQFSEDMYVAAKLIKANYSVGYCAEAKVYHSHNYSILDEYKRYQSIGKFHKENPWLQQEFGRNEIEGVKSVFAEWKYLINNRKINLLPSSLMRFGMKYLGYKSGGC